MYNQFFFVCLFKGVNPPAFFLVVKHSRKTMSRVALFKCVQWLGISFLVFWGFFYLEGPIFYT